MCLNPAKYCTLNFQEDYTDDDFLQLKNKNSNANELMQQQQQRQPKNQQTKFHEMFSATVVFGIVNCSFATHRTCQSYLCICIIYTACCEWILWIFVYYVITWHSYASETKTLHTRIVVRAAKMHYFIIINRPKIADFYFFIIIIVIMMHVTIKHYH